MRVAVVGAGAIGCTYAWFLARAGHRVAVVDVRRDHLETIARAGLVAEPFGDAVHVETEPCGPVDLLLFATKAFATGGAARGAYGLAGEETMVATVQNGIGNDRVLAAVFGAERTVAGATTVAAEPAGPGRVRIAESTLAGRSLTTLGVPRGAPALLPRVEAMCDELTAAGLPAVAVENADAVVWRKLVFAGSMAPLAAVLGLTVAETLEHAHELLVRLIDEIVAVARAEGVELDPEEIRRDALATFASLGPHRPSMAVDLAEGRRTEIDAMCLEVARRGRAAGVDVPVNEVVGALVRARER